MGIASNISIPALGVLMRASVAPPRSQCFLLQETNSEKSPLKILSVSPNLCVSPFCFGGHVVLFLC